MADSFDWLALAIGNSRLHWAWFTGDTLQAAWNTLHLSADAVQQLAHCQAIADFPAEFFLSLSPLLPCPIYLASVVESQTTLWKAYPDVRIITLEQIPLQGVYPTLGIDRALALWGAGDWGFPVLVVDAGTALTFTGADGDRVLVGGAILPGLGLQLQSLAQKTANLPQLETQNILSLPPRWALNTPESIQSGVIYTIIAGVRDFIAAWWQKFPESHVVLTGGDGNLLLGYLRSRFPEIASKIIFEPNLIFEGMQAIVRS